MRKARKEGPPDVMGVLSKQRWITPDEAEWHYISTRLGHLEKEGFKFMESGGWGDWSENYLWSVLAHDISLQMLRTRQKWEADNGKASPVDMYKELGISEAQKERNRQASQGMAAFFSEEDQKFKERQKRLAHGLYQAVVKKETGATDDQG